MRLTEMTDHETAAYLRLHGALDNFSSTGSSTTWRDSRGRPVVTIVYDNAANTRRVYVHEVAR